MKTWPGSIFSDFHFDYMKTSGRHPASIFLGEAPQRIHGAKHSPYFLDPRAGDASDAEGQSF